MVIRRDHAAAGALGAAHPLTRDSVASPAYAPALAARTLAMLDRNAPRLPRGRRNAGLVVRFRRLIFEAAGCSPQLQDPTAANTARRRGGPSFSALSNAKWGPWDRADAPDAEALRGLLQERPAIGD